MMKWKDCKVIAVIGDTGSGKTATCYSILDSMKKLKKYIYQHPQPQILDKTGIESLNDLDFDSLEDCLIWIDEPQLIFPKHDKKNNENLLRLCSLCRQKDIILVMSTSDTRWINRGLESYIDTWVIKNLDFAMVKQGSKIRNIIKEFHHNILVNDSFKLNKNEAIIDCREQLDKPRKWNIPLPKYWNDQYSKPYKNSLFNTHNINISPFERFNNDNRATEEEMD